MEPGDQPTDYMVNKQDAKGMAGQRTELSLSQIVKEVAQQQHQQTVEAEKSKSVLSNLQAQLFELEKENRAILQEIRTTEKQIYHLENESESRQQHCADLEAQLWSLNANNLQLKLAIQEEEEKYFKFLAEYDKYRKKMLCHKELTNQLESRSPIMMQLEEKIHMVKELKAKKEELAADLMNPEGNIIKQVQGEITELKTKISEMREAINEKSVLLIKEEERHVQLRKEIEVYSFNYGIMTVEVVLVDFSDVHYESIQKWLCGAVDQMSTCDLVECPYVFMMYSQRNTDNVNNDIQSYLYQLSDHVEMPKGNLEVLVQSSFAGILYTVKRKIDEQSLSIIKVIVSTERRATLELYIEQLFTAIYKFTFKTLVIENEEEVKLQLPVPAMKEHVLLSQQTGDIWKDIWAFLAQLKGDMGEIVVLQSLLIPDLFLHGFTTRTGGISYLPGLNSLNLFSSRKRRDPKAVVMENIRRLSARAGFNPKTFYLAKVSHGNTVWTLGKLEPEYYDGIVTNWKGVTIAAPGADCIPLLFADSVQQVCGVAHAGWKGTLAGVAMATVSVMMTEFGCSARDILVVMGPCIGPCCFTLHQEAAGEFMKIDTSCVKGANSPLPSIDLRRATRVLLERGGILSENISDDSTSSECGEVTLCTTCHPDMFFSYNRDGNNFGTQIGFISARELAVNLPSRAEVVL
ncbi:purine nucleoside phosphorylase LACC1-like [Scyliorhinus canicula]|uniref:purine nucleoside phosphorylase LACC1-like n=1 Tax=Scyliorhinus canicula TaxID=7830 RepID=UPI0018F7CEB0|nr:purine nucleoside phosphorylase LACC1-like [Scyliorhinus canicula]